MSLSREQVRDAMRAAWVKEASARILSPTGVESPWLFDFRRLLLKSDTLDAIANLMLDELHDIPAFQIGGLETSAIALVAGILTKAREKQRDMSGFYIRKSRRKDGLQKHIEGILSPEPIVLVDDILNTGRSFMRQIAALESEGRTVRTICVLLRFRDEAWYEEFAKRGIEVRSIFSLDDFPETGGTAIFALQNEHVAPRTPYEIEWKFQSADPSYYYVVPKSAPILDDSRVYFGADNGTMWALNQSDGSIAWSFRTLFGAGEKRIFSSPAIGDGRVYFGAYDGNFYCLRADTGKKEWVFREADWIGSSPAFAEDTHRVYVGLEFGLWNKQGGLACLDANTGAKRWVQPINTLVHSSPLYIKAHNMVVVGSTEGAIYAFSAENGNPLWTARANGAVRAGFAYDETTDTVCFGSEDSSLYMLDASTGTIRHRYETFEPLYATPLAEAGVLYSGALDKRIVAIDIKTGLLLWERWTQGRVLATPVRIDDSLFIGSNDGRLYELDTKTGHERSYFQTSERIVNSIAYDVRTKRIFLPTHANEMYCLRPLAR